MFVITARHQHRENGQIATWIVPATLVPDSPRVVTRMFHIRTGLRPCENRGRFVINMLADEQADLVPLFGLVSGNEIDKFDGLAIGRTATGLPFLPGICGWAECAIIAMIDSGDRRIYLADVVEQRVNPGKVPLRKADAFSRQPADILRLLQEKHRLDGIKDALLQKKFGHP